MTAAELKAAVRESLCSADLDEICENWSLPSNFAGTGRGFEHLVDVVTATLSKQLTKAGLTFMS